MAIFVFAACSATARPMPGHEARAWAADAVIEPMLLLVPTLLLASITRILQVSPLAAGISSPSLFRTTCLSYTVGVAFAVVGASSCGLGIGALLGSVPVSTIPLFVIGVPTGPNRLSRRLVATLLLLPSVLAAVFLLVLPSLR